LAKDDQEEAYDRVLVASLARTYDLMKFAEAKNAALLTFCSAWVFGSVNILSGGRGILTNFPIALEVALPFFVLAGLICLISLLPRLDPKSFYKKRPPTSLNLLFFGHMATVPVADAGEMLKRYLPEPGRSASDQYLTDLAAQIAINTQITARKYSLFNLGAYLVIAAFFILACPEGLRLWDRFSEWRLR
jgi:hypothetical protein